MSTVTTIKRGGLTAAIDSMGAQLTSLALNGNRSEHGGLEPASVLIGTLKINVGGPFKVRTVFADGEMA